MPEYIGKHLASQKLKELFKTYIEKDIAQIDVLDASADVQKIVKEIEPVDVIPRRKGRWVKDINGLMTCSCCFENAISNDYEEQVLSDYCPWCGVEMEKIEDETPNK